MNVARVGLQGFRDDDLRRCRRHAVLSNTTAWQAPIRVEGSGTAFVIEAVIAVVPWSLITSSTPPLRPIIKGRAPPGVSKPEKTVGVTDWTVKSGDADMNAPPKRPDADEFANPTP